jgi:formylglycine-generating enzyme required for sulfatase activity
MNRWARTILFLCAILAGCDRGSVEKTEGQAATETLVPVTNMVFVKAGSFLRKTQAIVISNDFWLGRYEVTQAEFSALTGKNPSHFKDQPMNPVEKLSFDDATAFCATLTLRERTAGRLPAGFEYRLPWEAEWEFACRAGSTNRFSFGDSATEAGPSAWTAENSDSTTHPVGLKKPNPWGFYDMHGNVWEWCQDWFEPEPGKPMPPNMPKAKMKIFKGGGWNQEAEFAGVANRFMMPPAMGINFVGFRIALAKSAKPPG